MNRTARRRVLKISLRDRQAGAGATAVGTTATAAGAAAANGDSASGAGAASAASAAGASSRASAAPASGNARDGAVAGGNARADMLAVEEPLEIRIGGEPLTVTMRTPGDDIDLAAGFLFCEGIVAGASGLASIRICGSAGQDGTEANIADVRLAGEAEGAALPRRSFLTTSACGICGKDSISDVRTRAAWDVAADDVAVEPAVLLRMPERLREEQRVFARTGGLHAAGLFTADGELVVLREDVGRHNAVDKVVGWALRAGRLPLKGCVLVVSGRASFELVQKAMMAGVPMLAAVSAPSSLAAELADEAGMTLAGFVRGSSMNIYAGAHRVRSLAGLAS